MKTIDKIITPIITILILLIGIWTITVFITGSSWYYDWQFKKNDTLEAINWTTSTGEDIIYTEDDLDNVKNHIIDFLFGKAESMQVVIDGHEFFSKQAINHMIDVKNLYQNWTIITIICAMLLIPCLIYFIKRFEIIKLRLFKQVSITYIVIGFLLAIIILFIVIDFNWTFTNFHHILFPNESSFNDAFFGAVSNYPEDNLNPYIHNPLLVEVLSIDVFLDAAWIIIVFVLTIMASWFTFAYIKGKKNIRNINNEVQTI